MMLHAQRGKLRCVLKDTTLYVVLCIFCTSLNSHAADALLTDIRMGKHKDFSRIVFEFQNDAPYHITPDHGSGRISIAFKGAATDIPASAVTADADDCIHALGMSPQDNDLLIDVTVSSARFQINPFALKEPFRLVVDITCLEEAETMAEPSRPEPEPIALGAADAPPISKNLPKKQDPDISGTPSAVDPADVRPTPSDQHAGFQNYLIVLLAVLSLIIIFLAGFIIYQYRTAHEKLLQESSAEKLKRSEDVLSSIDVKIRKKLQAHQKD